MILKYNSIFQNYLAISIITGNTGILNRMNWKNTLIMTKKLKINKQTNQQYSKFKEQQTGKSPIIYM